MRMPTLRSRVSFLRAKLYDHGAVPERPLRNDYSSREKEMYTVTLNKNVRTGTPLLTCSTAVRHTGTYENGLLYGERQPLL